MRQTPISIGLNSGRSAKEVPRQPCNVWKRSRNDRTQDSCKLSKTETFCKSRHRRNFISGGKRLFPDLIWPLKQNAGTQRNRCRKNRLSLFRSFSRNG